MGKTRCDRSGAAPDGEAALTVRVGLKMVKVLKVLNFWGAERTLTPSPPDPGGAGRGGLNPGRKGE